MGIVRSFPLTLLSWMVIVMSFCSSVVLLSRASILSLRLRLYSKPTVSAVMIPPMIKVQYRKMRNSWSVTG